MRIDLCVSYDDRHECKKHGGRWDAARQVWYVIDPQDMRPLMRWLPRAKFTQAGKRPPKQRKHQSTPVTTQMRSDGSIPDCGCMDVAPWEHCEHSAPFEPDPDQLEHLRACLAS